MSGPFGGQDVLIFKFFPVHAVQLHIDKKKAIENFKFVLRIIFFEECNQNGRNLNYLSPFFEPGLH